jgi:hypothetical protein
MQTQNLLYDSIESEAAKQDSYTQDDTQSANETMKCVNNNDHNIPNKKWELLG